MRPAGAAGDAHRDRLAYVLKVFPRVSETFVINEMRALEARGEDLAVFSLHRPDGSVPHKILGELKGRVHQIDALPTPVDADLARACGALRRRLGADTLAGDRVAPRKYVRLALAVRELMRAEGVCHLHAHFASRATHVALLAATQGGNSYSFTAHAKDIYHADVDRDLLRVKIAGARLVVTVTDHNREHLQRLVGDVPGAADKIVRIYNGVDLGRFRAAPAARDGVPVILGVGRLVEKKGFAVLVAACAILRRRGMRFRAEIVGGGPEEAALRRQVVEGGVEDRVAFRGVLATEEVADRLRQAAVVALPCVTARDGNVDALPTVLLEAMATARPVVSTRLSGIPEIVVDGETGLLVPPGDPEALAQALAAMLEQPEWAVALGGAGRRRAERQFDLRGNVAELHRRLRDAAGGGGS